MTDIEERIKQMMQSQKICELFMEIQIVPNLEAARFTVKYEKGSHCCRVYFGKTLNHEEFGPYDGISISVAADVTEIRVDQKPLKGYCFSMTSYCLEDIQCSTGAQLQKLLMASHSFVMVIPLRSTSYLVTHVKI